MAEAPGLAHIASLPTAGGRPVHVVDLLGCADSGMAFLAGGTGQPAQHEPGM